MFNLGLLDIFNYEENPIAFVVTIIAICLIAFILLFLLIFPVAKRHYSFKNFQNIYYKAIRNVADIGDYYLINNLVIKNNNQLVCRIDHVLFGDKYIYVIKDRYYRGAISGNRDDSTWFFYSNDGKKYEMENPMHVNEKRVEKLSLVTQIDRSFFISVVIINDNCVIKNANELNKDNSFIVSKKNFKKIIKMVEKRDVKRMDQKQLEYAVQDISRLYGKHSYNDTTAEDIY